MFLWLFPFPCVAGLSCLSQGCVDVCRSRGQRLPKAGVCDLHIPAQVTQLPSLCISCLLDKTSCLFSHPACAVGLQWVLWFRLGMWSCPFQAAWEQMWSFPLMSAQTFPTPAAAQTLHLPARCQQRTGFNLESGPCSIYKVDLCFKFAAENGRAHG